MASLEYRFGPRDVARWGWQALLAGEVKTAVCCFYVAIEWWVKS